MSDRIRVRCVLVVGDQAEIAADAPDAVTPERYPAADVARQAGIAVKDLPGRRMTAAVGDDDRLRDFRTA